MSPEEYRFGAVIDEITNVYTLGAIAFLFFGDERARSIEYWDAGNYRHQVATRAVSDDRVDRYQGIGEFAEAWRNDSGS